MPNGIDLDQIAFTQWRAQQGGILQPLDIGKTLKFSAISLERCVLGEN